MEIRCIKIKSCKECPFIGHNGAFASIRYIPCCERTGSKLPYTTNKNERGCVDAIATGIIPESCPLDKLEVI